MARTSAQSRSRILKERLEELRAAGGLGIDLREDMDFPELIFVEEDESPPDPDSHSWTEIDDDGRAYQITTKRAREATSVLGRCGVIDILRRKLGKLLGDSKLTITDVARLATDSEDNVRAHQKFLDRLNNGKFVTQANVERIAAALGLYPVDLFFDPPTIYSDEAAQQRQSSHGSILERRRDRLRQARKRHRVSLTLLDPRYPDTLNELINALEDDVHREVRDDHIDSDLRNAQTAVIARFVAALDPPVRKAELYQALLELQGVGISVWFGEYTDRVPVDRFDGPLGPVTSALRKVGVVVFSPVEQSPSLTVDLSHTVGMGVSLDEQLADLET